MRAIGKPKTPHETDYLALYEVLRKHLKGNAAKLKLFVMLVLGILLYRTVNLAEVALIFPGEIKQASFYRRLQRFFQNFAFPKVQFGQLLLHLLPEQSSPLVLAMDRTNWKFGRTHINLLQVGVVFEGVIYPLVWRTLPQATQRGNSSTQQRMELMGELLQVLPAARVECLVMDREFIGGDWLAWLNERRVCFVVRLRSNALLDERHALALAEEGGWSKETAQTYAGQGCPVCFAAKRLEQEEDGWLLLIGNGHEGEALLKLYQMRWGIECFFGHLKTRGFRFEDTHLRAGERIDKLVAALALAFVFSHRRGLEEEAKKNWP